MRYGFLLVALLGSFLFTGTALAEEAQPESVDAVLSGLSPQMRQCVASCMRGSVPESVPACRTQDSGELRRRLAQVTGLTRRLRRDVDEIQRELQELSPGDHEVRIVALEGDLATIREIMEVVRRLDEMYASINATLQQLREQVAANTAAIDEHAELLQQMAERLESIDVRVTALESRPAGSGQLVQFRIGIQGGGGVVHATDGTTCTHGTAGLRLELRLHERVAMFTDLDALFTGGDYPFGLGVRGGATIGFVRGIVNVEAAIGGDWIGYHSNLEAEFSVLHGDVGLDIRPLSWLSIYGYLMLGAEFDHDDDTSFDVGARGGVRFVLPAIGGRR